MKIQVENINKKIVTELDKVLEDLKEARRCATGDITKTEISKAQGRVETIKSLLED